MSCISFRNVLATVSLVLLIGCSSGDDKWKANRPKTVPAKGVLTLDGAPLDGAQIVLVSQGGSGNGASGLSGTDGAFTLSTFPPDEGAVPGTYNVMVVKSIVPEVQDMHGETEVYVPPTKATLLVPKKYTDPSSSGLTVTIPDSPEGNLDIKLDLKGK